LPKRPLPAGGCSCRRARRAVHRARASEAFSDVIAQSRERETSPPVTHRPWRDCFTVMGRRPRDGHRAAPCGACARRRTDGLKGRRRTRIGWKSGRDWRAGACSFSSFSLLLPYSVRGIVAATR
jgi:hypothetical protein